MKKFNKQTKSIVLSVAGVWFLAALVALGYLGRYAKTPGMISAAIDMWPTDTAIVRNAGEWTIVMAAHPECPCSKATVEELNQIAAKTGSSHAIHILFYLPREKVDDWKSSALWAEAGRLPRTTLYHDLEGVEIRKFGGQTSGQIYLFDQGGRLRFEGGITAARGHVGDNIGANAVLDLLNGKETSTTHTPVFGCHLFSSVESLQKGKRDRASSA